MKQENNYSEVDAAIFVHSYISPQMQQKYNIEQTEYLLDMVYEYYDTIDEIEENIGVNIMKMTSFINQNIDISICSPIRHRETGMLLDADNAYMESIGIHEENDLTDENMSIEEVSNGVYALLPQKMKDRYEIDDIFTVICVEYAYLMESEFEGEMYEYIQQHAADNGVKISIIDIQNILNAELYFLDGYDLEDEDEYFSNDFSFRE
ncbi:MAG: hypothetical protein LBH30_00875 [Prevotellaceae bacterium]|jgi:hypothetical protein|nr:hypothetical protein [Prevotellaceae bacterium]